MPNPIPELVVFDMAGTTVEDRGSVNRCLRDALAAAGVVVSADQVDAVMGIAKPEAIRHLIGDDAGKIALVDAIHRDFVGRMVAFYRDDPSIREVPGIGELLGRLRAQGIRVALDTGFSREIAQVIIDRLGWDQPGRIDASVTSDEVELGRPHPHMIRTLMQQFAIADPARVAKVGDAPADLEEGRNSGCGWVIGVTWGSHTRDQLSSHPHTALVDRIEELEAALGIA